MSENKGCVDCRARRKKTVHQQKESAPNYVDNKYRKKNEPYDPTDFINSIQDHDHTYCDTYIENNDDNDIDFVVYTDSESEDVVEEQKPLYDYVVVDFDILMQSVLFCRKCCSDNVVSEHKKSVGSGISMILTCNLCKSSWNWCSSQKSSQGRLVNSDISAASVLCGISYTALEQFFGCLRMPHLKECAHHNLVKRRIAPVVSQAFENMQDDVNKLVVERGEKTGKINVCGDAMFDSPGYCARVCRYAILEVETGLVLEVEAIRKQRHESSKAQEPKALEIALRRLNHRVHSSGKNVKIDSITTDRDMAVRKMLHERFASIKTFYDCWHFAKNLQKTLAKKKDQVQMIPVKNWIRPLANHLYYSVASSAGNGQLAVEKFMSFFLHIQNNHTRFKSVGTFKFKEIKQCQHGHLKVHNRRYLNLKQPADLTAFNVLLNMTATPKRLQDLQEVSPHWATSQVESFNSLSILYTPKSRFYSENGYKMRMQLSVLHWNELKLSMIRGEREKSGQKSYYSKVQKKMVWKDTYEKGVMKWRSDIFDAIRKGDIAPSSSVYVDEDETEGMDLEELALDEFGFEIEADDSDSDEENEISIEFNERLDENWEQEEPLQISRSEQLALMKDWKSLVVDKKERIPNFSELSRRSAESDFFTPTFSFGQRCDKMLKNSFKSTRYKDVDLSSAYLRGESDDEEYEGGGNEDN